MDKKIFFDAVRSTLFRGTLRKSQVDGLERLVDLRASSYPEYTNPEFAYLLATDYTETDAQMQPIPEYDGGDRTYFFRMYDMAGERPEVARELGNVHPGDGELFHGRGDVQTTGRKNYEYWSRRLKLPLDTRPDLMLDPAVSGKVAFEGMRDGTFTGKKLADYFSETASDPLRARRIINGMDRAELIAGNYARFLSALQAAG